jgi:ABC-type nickel/cobalt efflux system permease component RcnA
MVRQAQHEVSTAGEHPRWRSKILLVSLIALAVLAAPPAALAHPLGNFTINRYSRIVPSGDHVYVLYILDMAEIPTFQERQTIRSEGETAYANGLVRTIASGLRLDIDGRPLRLKPSRHALAFPPGQAGLHTLRFESLYETGPIASDGTAKLSYRDANFADRIGWKEIVVAPSAGARVHDASTPSQSISDELRAYPKDLLQSPLDVTRAEATFTPGRGMGLIPRLHTRAELEQRVRVRAIADSGFARLIARDHLGTGFIVASLLLAMFWGAAHAFSPGHGKSIIAAYLVGSRGTPRHAVLLGLTVTITHTIGVFALGLITLTLSAFIVPDQLYPWLNLVSALLIVGVGISVLRWRLREWRRAPNSGGHHCEHGDDEHAHGHALTLAAHNHAAEHRHNHHRGGCSCKGHGHDIDPAVSIRRLLGVGISGGIIPCPTALVVLLAAISLHRVGYGLVLILAFSVGLAGAMTGIGLLAVTAKRLFNRVNFELGLLRLLPALSALVVLGLGLAMTARALPKLT